MYNSLLRLNNISLHGIIFCFSITVFFLVLLLWVFICKSIVKNVLLVLIILHFSKLYLLNIKDLRIVQFLFYIFLSFKVSLWGPREITQWLRALAALSENLSSLPKIHMVAAISNSSSRGSDAPFWSPWTLHALGTQTYAAKHPVRIKQE